MDHILLLSLHQERTTTDDNPIFQVIPHLEGGNIDDSTSEDVAIPEVFRRFYQGELVDFVDPNIPSNRKRKTISYRLDLAYRGTAFCGWQTQVQNTSNRTTVPPPQRTTRLLPAVQDVVQAALDDRNVRVAGRTDAGVHAVGQVARVRCDPRVSIDQLRQQLQAAALENGNWACRRILPVTHSFHPTFGATSRSYVYLIDANPEWQRRLGPVSDFVKRLNGVLTPLEGQTLPYLALSYGKLKTSTSHCTLHHVRARLVTWRRHEPVVAIELTGDRFLRRMVRILVATAVRLAADVDDDPRALYDIVQSMDRRQAALPAPAAGLVFLTASYE